MQAKDITFSGIEVQRLVERAFLDGQQAEHDRQRIDALLLRDDPRPERLLVTSP